MSQPEPVASPTSYSEAVGSEGAPQSQSQVDSAAPVSPSSSAAKPSSSRLNPNATDFVPRSFITAQAAAAAPAFGFGTPYVPVYQDVSMQLPHPMAVAPSSMRKPGGRGGRGGLAGNHHARHFQSFPSGQQAAYLSAMHIPASAGAYQHGAYFQAYGYGTPDAHFNVQQADFQQPMQHIMLAQELEFPHFSHKFNANAQSFTPSSPSHQQKQSDAVSPAPQQEEEEPVDPNAPLTWAQRIKLANAKSAAPAKAAPPQTSTKPLSPKLEPQQPESAASVEAEAEAPAEAEAAAEVEEEEEGRDEAVESTSSSFMEAVAGVDCERRIYSVDFLMKFREYSDPAIPVKELIPVHLYLQPVHEDESLSWRTSSAAALAGRQQTSGRGAGGRGGAGRRGGAPLKVSGVLLEPLKRAEHSWSAVQAKLKSSLSPEEDEKVERLIRGLLNKLTSDKYEKLKTQLFSEEEINIRTYDHISILIRLLFEKATQQHHFIPLYADLCRDCKDWLASSPDAHKRFALQMHTDGSSVPDPKEFFRRTLTEQCQQAFDSFLVVPSTPAGAAGEAAVGGGSVSMEDQYAEEVKYRTKVWGNLKLIGQLIARRIISSKVAMKCIDELLAQGNNETLLEALAVFLTDVARLIDNPNWEYHPRLEEVFKHLASLAQKSTNPQQPRISSKCRFALQNLIDLRKNNWQVSVPAPVAPSPAQKSQQSQPQSGISGAKTGGAWKPKTTATASSLKPTSSFSGWGKGPLPGLPGAEKPAEADAGAQPRDDEEKEETKKECRSALKELRASRDVEETVRRLKETVESLEESEKISLFGTHIMTYVLEADSKDLEILLEAVTKTIGDSSILKAIVENFIDGPMEDVKIDLPNVSSILKQKVLPTFFPQPSSSSAAVDAILQRLGH